MRHIQQSRRERPGRQQSAGAAVGISPHAQGNRDIKSQSPPDPVAIARDWRLPPVPRERRAPDDAEKIQARKDEGERLSYGGRRPDLMGRNVSDLVFGRAPT